MKKIKNLAGFVMGVVMLSFLPCYLWLRLSATEFLVVMMTFACLFLMARLACKTYGPDNAAMRNMHRKEAPHQWTAEQIAEAEKHWASNDT